MTTPAERLRILERLEKGEIGADEAAAQLASTARPATPLDILGQVDRGEIDADEAARRLESAKRPSQKEEPFAKKVKAEVIDDTRFEAARTWGWWLLPLAFGVVVTAVSALWMTSSLTRSGLGLAFFCSWVPLAIGLLLVIVGWAIHNGHWIHVQVASKKPGRHINFDLKLPMPVNLATGLMEGFGIHIPGLDKESVDHIVDVLHESRRNGNPVHIKAKDQDDDNVDIVIS